MKQIAYACPVRTHKVQSAVMDGARVVYPGSSDLAWGPLLPVPSIPEVPPALGEQLPRHIKVTSTAVSAPLVRLPRWKLTTWRHHLHLSSAPPRLPLDSRALGPNSFHAIRRFQVRRSSRPTTPRAAADYPAALQLFGSCVLRPAVLDMAHFLSA